MKKIILSSVVLAIFLTACTTKTYSDGKEFFSLVETTTNEAIEKKDPSPCTKLPVSAEYMVGKPKLLDGPGVSTLYLQNG